MVYSFTAEQLCLLRLATTTWTRRAAAKRQQLPLGEESITQDMHLDLDATFPGSVVIIPFTKPREGRTGADWAWAFVSADGARSTEMLVQAKSLDFNDVEYPEIKRAIGKTRPRVRQIDRLIETAERWGLPPVYAFYNHLDDPSRLPDNCISLQRAKLGPLSPSWGISLADAYNVRSVLNDQSFDTHRSHSMPFHCLFCSAGSGHRGPAGSPGRALDSLHLLRGLGGRDGETDIPPLPDQPSQRLHSMFNMALQARAERGPAIAQVRRVLAGEFRGIDGVVVLRDAPDEKEAERRVRKTSDRP